MSEYWVKESAYCPGCGSSLQSFKNNKPVADFMCASCGAEYELKSKSGSMGRKVPDGAYSTMIDRLRGKNNPHLFFLIYEKATLKISDFMIVPRCFFVPAIIEQRKPLGPLARRAGWVGCNIRMDAIPELGKIYYVRKGAVINKSAVLTHWGMGKFLDSIRLSETKGWLLDVLRCVEDFGGNEFTLGDVYAYAGQFEEKYPNNRNIKAKIRQQLQRLRDHNIINFTGRGRYVLIASTHAV